MRGSGRRLAARDRVPTVHHALQLGVERSGETLQRVNLLVARRVEATASTRKRLVRQHNLHVALILAFDGRNRHSRRHMSSILVSDMIKAGTQNVPGLKLLHHNTTHTLVGFRAALATVFRPGRFRPLAAHIFGLPSLGHADFPWAFRHGVLTSNYRQRPLLQFHAVRAWPPLAAAYPREGDLSDA